MAVNYKTLILIDNSNSVGDVNISLSKEIAKYIIRNKEEGDSVMVATFGENVEKLTEYVIEEQELTEAIDSIEPKEKNTCITDSLTSVLLDWRESDVALRNIILFTDGEENESVNHADAELYHLLEESDYPVYVVHCVGSKDTEATMNLSAIATISNAGIFKTEFPGSDAASETIIGQKILDSIQTDRERKEALLALDSERAEEEALNEYESEELSVEQVDTEEMYIASDKVPEAINTNFDSIAQGMTSQSDYLMNTESETVNPQPIIKSEEKNSYLNIIIPVFMLIVSVLVALGVVMIIRKRCEKRRKDIGISFRSKNIQDDEWDDTENIFMDDYSSTRNLVDDDCEPTRLLSEDSIGRNIVLEDCNDPTRLFRASCIDKLVVGRSKSNCDVVVDYDDSVSGKHCEISVKGNEWYVRDLQSSNGTRVNQQKVFQELLLKSGDILQLGQLSLYVRV